MALVAVAANAQETKPMGLSLKAGAFFPSKGAAKSAGKTWFIGGVEYKLKNSAMGTMGTGMNGELSLSVDFFQKGDFRNVPVLINWTGGQSEFYYTAGIGLGFTKIPTSSTTTESKSTFAYAFGVGYNFQQGKSPLFVEVKYYGSSKSDLNGVAALVGFRF